MPRVARPQSTSRPSKPKAFASELTKSNPRGSRSRGSASPQAQPTASPSEEAQAKAVGAAVGELRGNTASRTRTLLSREIAFIHNRDFATPEFERLIESSAKSIVLPASPPAPDDAETIPKGLPTYFHTLYRHPLLTSEQETVLFRQMYYFKYRANAMRAQLTLDRVSEDLVDQIEQFLAMARDVRDLIINSNLRLVVSLARKYAPHHQSFDELVSEGHLALIRAVEKFDYGLGYRFSTYATYAIQRDMYRLNKKHQTEANRVETSDLDIAMPGNRNTPDEDAAALQFRRYVHLRDIMNQQLDPRDRQILVLRFGLDDELEPQSLQSIGALLSLSKERIRQLEARALSKLQSFMEPQP